MFNSERMHRDGKNEENITERNINKLWTVSHFKNKNYNLKIKLNSLKL